MSFIPTPDEALTIIKKYNKEEFHIQHAIIVSKVMCVLALKFDPENVKYWESVGMLHDVDYELFPEEHCTKAIEILNDENVDSSIINSVISHGYGICSDVQPTKYMEKILYATDELTGLIGAIAIMRPNGITDMEVSSIKKKFKDKKFAAGCSRDVISNGAKMLNIELDELFSLTLNAMKA